ncbi:MAG: hypothetical protein GX638_15165, partial [Crenarchaeota archaeon]|nr:hypothetical protein [Thermoproteota archaeon]
TIIEHENTTFKKYSRICEKHESDFKELGCILKLEQIWSNSRKKIKLEKWGISFYEESFSKTRIPFGKGYSCYLQCEVERNGKTVRYDNHNGEVDYYELSMSWIISSLTHRRFITECTLYQDTNAFAEELDHFIKTLKSTDVDFL